MTNGLEDLKMTNLNINIFSQTKKAIQRGQLFFIFLQKITKINFENRFLRSLALSYPIRFLRRFQKIFF